MGTPAHMKRMEAVAGSFESPKAPADETTDYLFSRSGKRLSPWTEVLLTNVILATATTVILFGAPLAWAALGGVTAGMLLGVSQRLRRTRRCS
jgi:hypothetical protein